MTDVATHVAGLAPYAGRDVVRVRIAVQKTGDGLSEAMSIEPIELPLGWQGQVVMDVEVKRHEHEPIVDGPHSPLELKLVMVASTATIIDAEVVREALDAQRERIELAREEAAGISRLPIETEAYENGQGEDADADA